MCGASRKREQVTDGQHLPSETPQTSSETPLVC
jgi:hypothetical protein